VQIRCKESLGDFLQGKVKFGHSSQELAASRGSAAGWRHDAGPRANSNSLSGRGFLGPNDKEERVKARENISTIRTAMPKIVEMSNTRPVLLIVEDNEDDIFFIERIFKQLGARCELKFARDGIEAVDYLSGKDKFKDREQYPMPTIILMDLKMPRKNGFEVLEWMQTQGEIKLIPTIVVTSSTLQEDVTKAYRLGANAVMNKPVDKDSLLQMLKSFHIYWTDYVEMPEVKPSAVA